MLPDIARRVRAGAVAARGPSEAPPRPPSGGVAARRHRARRGRLRTHAVNDPADIPISFIGLRPGEKLHEELMTAEKEVAATQHNRIKVVRASGLPTWPDIQTIIPAYHPSTLLAPR